MSVLSFQNKVVLITGGSKGIGAGCARVFVGAGASVVICARGRNDGLALAAELTEAGPGECFFEPCDVRIPEEIERLVAATVERYGHLDCLINNAGWHPPHRPIDDFAVDEFMELLQTNVVSCFAAAKIALPYLRESKGSIINMGSAVGNTGQWWATTYCATKAAIHGLTRALAIDEAPNRVRVNAVLPGAILTDGARDFISEQDNPREFGEYVDGWQWLGRQGKAEEVGAACLFLASENARFITGIELIVSGGIELGQGPKGPILPQYWA